MQEPASRLFTDSVLSRPFSTRASISRLSSGLGSAVGLIVGGLVVCQYFCSKIEMNKI
jgi:hypothetical protein